jgi:hypothetical protein
MLVHQYLAALPNFTVDETTTLYKSPALATPKWRVTETLQAEANFQRGRETRRNITRNGVKWQDSAILPSAFRAIQVVLDRWHNAQIGASVARFVERIEKSDRIVMVGTPLYRRKYENKDEGSGYVGGGGGRSN